MEVINNVSYKYSRIRNCRNNFINSRFQTESTGARIVGDGNTVSRLANVNPQINAGVNLLNTVTQTVSGAAGSGNAGNSDELLDDVLGGVGGATNNIGGNQISKYIDQCRLYK